MEATFKVSVRTLVAFSYFSPDITPGASTTEMLAGTRAHQARESAQADEFETEKPVSDIVELDQETVTVFGRMDAFREGDPPCVEEIKLCGRPPEVPLPEHLAQTRLYGALLATASATVELRVVYVNEAGEPMRVFTELADRPSLSRFLQTLLTPWLAFAVEEREHRRVRNASLRAMPFPFDAYRAGQHELAAQVYTAIVRKKRLFATLPTGTGKSAAVLFPALKALGEGKTRQIFYLTARTTARQSPLNALERMRSQGMRARVMTLLAKDKLCPSPARCHPDDCPRAKGHFIRQPDALRRLMQTDALWTDERISAVADEFCVCPFELALSCTELADVVLMDLNFAFDPFVQIARVFRQRRDFTLLTDEAHHLLSRMTDNLSGTLDSRELRAYRALIGKSLGRRHPCYKLLSQLLAALRATGFHEADPDVREDADAGNANPEGTEPAAPPEGAEQESRLTEPPEAVVAAAQAVCEATANLLYTPLPGSECRKAAGEMLRKLCVFSYAAQHFSDRYAVLLTCKGRERLLELYCLSPAEVIATTTKGLRGAVFFSATLSPLPAMRQLLGGTEEDACFSLPSPFPPERLAVIRKRVQTRYAYREASAEQVARCIAEAVAARPGKYIAYFPSYAYLRLVQEQLSACTLPPLFVQDKAMDEDARVAFMEVFTKDEGPCLGLCVLGGLFSEGVDLPGEQLIGAIIVGVGLPTPSLRLKTLQAYYEERFGDGFLYAWIIPAMQKVSQAAGRVIRTEKDKGLVLLLDDRYFDSRYLRLLPPEWHFRGGTIAQAAYALNRLEE